MIQLYDFNKDIQFSVLENWERCISKMKTHINILSKRSLSLKGKAMILNSLILSKASFISNVFTISKEKLKTIETLIFQYIWFNEKSEPIARKTLFLEKEKWS